MSRTTQTRRTAPTTAAAFEAMEARTMYSATPAVVAYLPDYRTSATMVQSLLNAAQTGVTQVNYFSVQPDAATGTMPGMVNPVTKVAEPAVSSGIDWNTNAHYALSQLSDVVTAAHRQTAKVDVNVVVGGAGLDNSLQTIIDTPARQGAFAASVGQFAAAYHVDGVELDWEPTAPSATEIANYGTLIHTVKVANPTLRLSAAVDAERSWLNDNSRAYVLNRTAVQNLDQVTVMAYDLQPGAGASPVAATEADMAALGTYVTANGGSNGQLLFGVPFYGHGNDAGNTAMTYNDILTAAPTGAADARTIDGVTYSFNGPATIAAKTNYALNNGFGGVAAWEAGQDRFDANGHYTTGSLMPVIQQTVATYAAAHAPVATPTPTPTQTPTPTPTPTATGARLTGTAISSYRFENMMPGNGFIASTFDGNTNTYFSSGQASGWYGLHLNAPALLSQVSFAPRAGHGYNMTGGAFQAANTADFSDGVTLAIIAAAPASGVMTTLNVDPTLTHTAYTYVRYLAPLGSHGEAAEIAFIGNQPQGSVVAAATATYTASNRSTPTAFADNASAIVDLINAE